jgi:hypothetical protein
MDLTKEIGVLDLIKYSLKFFFNNIAKIFLIFIPLILLTLLGSIPVLGFLFSIFHFLLVAFSNISIMKFIYDKEYNAKENSFSELVSFIKSHFVKFSKIAVINWIISIFVTGLLIAAVVAFLAVSYFALKKMTVFWIILFVLTSIAIFAILFFTGRIFINIAFVFQAAAVEDFDTAWKYFIHSKKTARSHPGKTDGYFFWGVILLLPIMIILGIVLFPVLKVFSLMIFLGMGISIITVINITLGALLLIFILNLYFQIKSFPKKPEVLDQEFKNIF